MSSGCYSMIGTSGEIVRIAKLERESGNNVIMTLTRVVVAEWEMA